MLCYADLHRLHTPRAGFSQASSLHIEQQTNGQTDVQSDRQADRQADKTDGQTDKTDRQCDGQKGQTDGQTDRHTDRQTDRQTDRHDRSEQHRNNRVRRPETTWVRKIACSAVFVMIS